MLVVTEEKCPDAFKSGWGLLIEMHQAKCKKYKSICQKVNSRSQTGQQYHSISWMLQASASPAFQSAPQYGFLFSFSHFFHEEKDPQLLSHVAVFIWLRLRPCWRHQDFATNFSSHVWKYWSICYTNCMATIHCASLNCIHADKMFYCTWSIANENESLWWN